MRSAHGYWPIILMMCAVSAVSYLERTNVSVVGHLMRPDLGLDESQLGNIFSAFTFGYAVFQFPAGFLADKLGPRRVLSVALICWGVFNVLTALVQPIGQWLGVFGTLLIIRLLLGITQAPTYPGAARSLLAWVPSTRRALANAIVIAGIGLGSALAPVFLGPLAVGLDWQLALIIGATPAFALSIILFCFGRDDPDATVGSEMRGPMSETSANMSRSEAGGLLNVGLRLATKRSLWMLTLSYMLQGYISYVFVFWFFHYLVEVRHFSTLQSSWLATMPWLLTIVTTPLGGLASDQLVHRLGYPWGRRLLPMVALVLARKPDWPCGGWREEQNERSCPVLWNRRAGSASLWMPDIPDPSIDLWIEGDAIGHGKSSLPERIIRCRFDRTPLATGEPPCHDLLGS